MEPLPTWFINSFIYLSATVIVVPLSRALGLSSIIGYLAAGVAFGPWGLGLVTNVQDILHFAEFAVVLMLFLVGLELEPKRLWSLRRPIFGWGSAQMAGCAAAIFLLPTGSGQAGFSILLFQDVAAILILALLPLLAGSPEPNQAVAPVERLQEAIEIIAVIAGIVVGGRLLLRPLLRWIARGKTPEIFTAAPLLLLVGIAALIQIVGLSMALGAFLAGVLLAESEYRRELETNIEPFKGLLLGLFFIAVGMGVDLGVLRDAPLQMAAVVLGFLAAKSVVIFVIARLMKLPLQKRPVFTLLLVAIGKLLLPRCAHCGVPVLDEISEQQNAPVLVAGFGRYGQVVSRVAGAGAIVHGAGP